MSGSKTILIISLLVVHFTAAAQNEGFTSSPNKKGQHSLVAYISGGGSYYVGKSGSPGYLSPQVKNLNPIGSLRLMWHPDHLLKLGIETGYLTFYSYSFSDSLRNSGKVSLDAVPVLVEWSTSIAKHWNLFVGSGIYILTTNLDYRGKTRSQKLSVGWMAAGSYIAPVSENLGLGAELKWMNAAEASAGSVSLQLQLVWKLAKW